MHYKKRTPYVLLLFLGIAALLSSPANAEYESSLFGVNNFGTSAQGLCCSSCSDSDWNLYTTSMANEGFDYCDYDQRERYSNTAVDGRDWTDDDKRSWGTDDDDPLGTDFADVVMISSHGYYECGPFYHSSFEMGDYHSAQDCTIYTHAYVDDEECVEGHMKFGGGDGEELNVMLSTT